MINIIKNTLENIVAPFWIWIFTTAPVFVGMFVVWSLLLILYLVTH